MKALQRTCWLLCLLLLCTGCPAAPGGTPEETLRQQFRAFLFAGRRIQPIRAAVILTHQAEGRRVERVRFETEPGERVVAVLARPERAEGRLPTVMVQHYLGGSKDDTLIQALVWQLAGRGFLAVAIDGRYRGERSEPNLKQAIQQALESGKGRPWLVDTVYDVLRTIDYLITRPDVDPQRIGMLGISEGGIETWMAAAADVRIAVVVPLIGVTRFARALDDLDSPSGEARVRLFQPYLGPFALQLGEKQVNARVVREAWDRLVPGLRDQFDADRLLPLVAPRPLLILNHERDELFPLEGAREAYEAARRRYIALGAGDRIRMDVAPGLPHAGQDPAETAALFNWLERWLKPGVPPRAPSGDSVPDRS